MKQRFMRLLSSLGSWERGDKQESGVSYSKIYNVLDALIGKNLVKVIPEKSKKFIPSSPEALIELIEKKTAKPGKSQGKSKRNGKVL